MGNNNCGSNNKQKELDEHFKENQDGLPACPTCQSKKNVIPSVQGYPSPELISYAKKGKVKLSGCTQGYQGWCKKCQKFI